MQDAECSLGQVEVDCMRLFTTSQQLGFAGISGMDQKVARWL